MKKVFLSIFVLILLISFGYSISYKAACDIGNKTQKEFQEIVRNNLFMFDSFGTNTCKLKKNNLYDKCTKMYPKYHGEQCLQKMLNDGKVGPFTCAVYNLELHCMNDSLLNTNPMNRFDMVNLFCLYMSDYVNGNNLDFINAQNSVFLKILCNETGIYTAKQFAKNVKIKDSVKKYYGKLVKDAKKDSFINFGLFGKCKNTDGIVVNADGLNNVNFVCVANDIWNKLATDEINLGSYIVYGGFVNDNGLKKKDNGLKKWEKSFFVGNKGICSNGYLYAGPEKAKDSVCNHPDTYRFLKTTQSSLKDILSNLNLFPKLNGYDDIGKIIGGTGNAFLKLRDSIYNELYFYTYFLSYYGEMVQNNTSNLQLKKVGTTIKSVDLSTAKEFLQAKKSIIVARLSLKKSFDILKNIYWTYPIHIGFLAIIEDFKALRQDLAMIYTPLDQLRYKLENVQDLSKH